MKIFTAVVGLKRKRPVLVQTLLIHISAAKERSNSIHNFFFFHILFFIWNMEQNLKMNWKILKNIWKYCFQQITNTILIFHYFSKNEKIICSANKWEVTKRKWVIFAKASAYFLVQQIQPPPSLARIALNHSLFSELCFVAIASPQREIGNQLFKLMWKH